MIRAALLLAIIAAAVDATAQVSVSTGGMSLVASQHPAALNLASTRTVMDAQAGTPAPHTVTYLNSMSIHVGHWYLVEYPETPEERPFLDLHAVEPSTAVPGAVFTFRVTYRDLQGDPPAVSSAPRMFLRKGMSFYNQNALGYAMTFSTGANPTTGLLYSCTVQITAPGDDYTWYVAASDLYGYQRITDPVPGPAVNTPPRLTFTGDAGYTDTALQPSTGSAADVFSFRIMYTDPDGHPPATGHPVLAVHRGTWTVYSTPMTLSGGGLPHVGMVYIASVTPSEFATAGNPYGQHTYSITAADSLGTSTATAPMPGPLVVSVPTVALTDVPARFTPHATNYILAVIRSADGQYPHAGYPMLTVRIGTTTVLDVPMEHHNGDPATGATWRAMVQFSTVTNAYTCTARTLHPTGYGGTVVSSPAAFAVTSGPNPPVSTTVYDDPANNVSLNSRCTLSWSCHTPDTGTVLTYRLYLGRSGTQPLPLVYSGAAQQHTVYGLAESASYTWYVVAVDNAEADARSVDYTFRTSGLANNGKPFNYPNPFNPATEPTNIVYSVDRACIALLRVYTERGRLVHSSSHDALPGMNTAIYDGRDQHGNILPNGSYIYEITATGVMRHGYLLVLTKGRP
jgi:hypothetical protein